MGDINIKIQNKQRGKRKTDSILEDDVSTTRKRPKWTFLQHNGPRFAPPYQSVPERIPFLYASRRVKLSPPAEEIATFYAKITNKNISNSDTFQKNFFNDWRKSMTDEERSLITDLSKCNFRHLRNYFQHEKKHASEIRKEKRRRSDNVVKEKYGFCDIDGIQHEIENFKIEPGIFLGRGNHPKLGKIKRRVSPEDVTINCSEDSEIPRPGHGHTWKVIVHDETVTWLAKWRDNVLNKNKYIKLKTCSELKSHDDERKYQKARELDGEIDRIRKRYFDDLNSEEIEIRERAVALYLIDRLGFRTGNEKNEDEADTVGCCSLRVKHIRLHEDGNVSFDFLGKSSIRYHTELSMSEEIFNNLRLLQAGKSDEDPLFDHLTPPQLNSHLCGQMEGLTARVFRTYNASSVFERLLDEFTDPKSADDEKIRCYGCANLAVAIFLNHRTSAERAETKEWMSTMKTDIHESVARMGEFGDAEEDRARTRRLLRNLKDLLCKNEEILTATSRENYLDPRISVAWCERFGVGIERVFTGAERRRFERAVRLKNASFRFSVKADGCRTFCVNFA